MHKTWGNDKSELKKSGKRLDTKENKEMERKGGVAVEGVQSQDREGRDEGLSSAYQRHSHTMKEFSEVSCPFMTAERVACQVPVLGRP